MSLQSSMMSCSLLLRCALLALLCLSASPAVSAQTYYSFCYYQQNTLATSPYLPWSTYAQGTLSVAALGTALTVIGATGTREVYVQGKALQTNNILGVSAPLAYGDNDNQLNSTAPFLSGRHALTFYLDGVAQFAQGPAIFRGAPSGTNNVSINAWTQYSYSGNKAIAVAFAESDMPPNDGATNVIVGAFQLTPTTSYTNSFAGCTLPRPAAPTIAAAVLTAYNALTTWPMCYQFVFGQEGLGSAGFVTTVSAVITTRGYLGADPTGLATGYLAVGINGTRNFTVQSNSLNIPSQSYIVSLIGIGAPLAPYLNFLSYNSTSALRRYPSNVLYPTFPQIDQWGLAILTNTSVLDEYTATVNSSAGGTAGIDRNLLSTAQTNTTSFMLYTDSSYLIYDVIWKLNVAAGATTVARDTNWADTLNVQTQAQYNALVPSVYANQAAWTTGVCGNDYTVTPTKYNFCWYATSPPPSLPPLFSPSPSHPTLPPLPLLCSQVRRQHQHHHQPGQPRRVVRVRHHERQDRPHPLRPTGHADPGHERHPRPPQHQHQHGHHLVAGAAHATQRRLRGLLAQRGVRRILPHPHTHAHTQCLSLL